MNRALTLLACTCLGGAGMATQAAANLQGRSVSSVLHEISSPQLSIVYSSQLVPDALRVAGEPAAGADKLALARAILEPHGLELRALAPGVYVVAAAAERAVPAPPGPLDVEEMPALLEDVVISGRRLPFGSKGRDDALILSGARLATQTTPGEDSLRSLAHMPGIAQEGSFGRLNIRGSRPDEVAILLDGFQLRHAYHIPGLHGLLSVIDPGVVADIALYTGAMPARFGGGMSGVVDMHTINAGQGTHGSLGLGFLSGRARYATSFSDDGRNDALVAARLGSTGYLAKVMAPASGRPSYSDVYGRLRFGVGADTNVTVNMLVAGDSLAVHRDGLDEESAQNSGLSYVWLKSTSRLGDATQLTVWLGNSRMNAERSGTMDSPGFASGALSEHQAEEAWDAHASLAMNLGTAHSLEVGAEASRERRSYLYSSLVSFDALALRCLEMPSSRAEELALQPLRTTQALYVSDRWTLLPRLTAFLGARLQQLDVTGGGERTVVDPRLSLAWEVDEGLNLRAGWGRATQTRGLDDIRPRDQVEPDYLPPQSEYFTLGLDQAFGNGFVVRGEGFVKRQAHLRPMRASLLRSPSILPELSFDQMWIRPRTAQMHGVEMFLQREGRDVHWSLSYSWSQARDHFATGVVARDWDQRSAANFSLDWKIGPWLLTGSLSARAGQPTTQIALAADGTVILGARNQTRLATTFGADLRAEWRHAMPSGSLAVALQLSNLLAGPTGCCSELAAQTGADGLPRLVLRPGRVPPPVPWIGVSWDL